MAAIACDLTHLLMRAVVLSFQAWPIMLVCTEATLEGISGLVVFPGVSELRRTEWEDGLWGKQGACGP